MKIYDEYGLKYFKLYRPCRELRNKMQENEEWIFDFYKEPEHIPMVIEN